MMLKLLHLMTKYKLHSAVAHENMFEYSEVGGLRGYHNVFLTYLRCEPRRLLIMKIWNKAQIEE